MLMPVGGLAVQVLIQQLKEENERLKKMGASEGVGSAGMSEEEREAMRKVMEEEMQAKMEENLKALEEMNKGWEEKLKEAQVVSLPTLRPCGHVSHC